jgi:hypothetical protein
MDKMILNPNQDREVSLRTITNSKTSSSLDNNLKNQNENNSKNLKAARVNVLITYSYSNESAQYNDVFPKLLNPNTILLNDLFEELVHKGCNLNNTAISYYDSDLKTHIYCGIIPFACNVSIPYQFEEGNVPLIQIRSRQIIRKDNLMRMELNEENPDQTDENNQNVFINVKSKRSKERKIGFIIEKVFLWRKLYNGFIDDRGSLVKLTLEEAADKVGISKKSLDDYLIQLR